MIFYIISIKSILNNQPDDYLEIIIYNKDFIIIVI